MTETVLPEPTQVAAVIEPGAEPDTGIVKFPEVAPLPVTTRHDGDETVYPGIRISNL